MPIACSAIASNPAVTCSPEATTRVIFARVVHRGGVAAPFHQLVGLAGHRGNHDGDVMTGIDLALHMARDVADAVDIGDGGAAEFHHEAAHDDRCIPLRG